MKKLIAILVIAALVVPPPPKAQAEVMTATIIGAAVLGAAIATIGAVSYHKAGAAAPPLPHAPSAWTTAANVGRMMYAGWYEYNQYNQAVLKGKLVEAKVTYDQLKAWVVDAADGITNYPKFWLAMHGATPESHISETSSVNDKVMISNQWYQVTSKFVGTPYQTTEQLQNGFASGFYYIHHYEATGQTDYMNRPIYIYTQYQFVLGSTTAPTPPLLTAQQIASGAKFGANNILAPELQTELDAILAAKMAGGSISVIDTVYPEAQTDTAPPFVVPVAAVGPATAAAAPLSPSVSGLGAQTQAAADSAAQTAAQALQQAQDALAADPNNAALQQAVQQAQQAAAAATAAAQQAAQATKEQYTDNPVDEIKKFKWDKLAQLKGVMVNMYPFYLLPRVRQYYEVFITPEHTAPVITLPLMGNNMTLDLSMFDSLAAICRFILSVVSFTGAIYLIVRFWRGVS